MTGSGDLKNIQRRGDRKARHESRANEELEEFFKLYASKIEIITYNPIEWNREYKEYFVRFRLDQPMKPNIFFKLLIDTIGDSI